LRDALGDSADVPRYIETLPRVGYRFIAPVTGLGDKIVSDQPAVAAATKKSIPWVGVVVGVVAGLLLLWGGVAGLGYVYGISGRRAQALKTLDELAELSHRTYVSPYEVAMIYESRCRTLF
jgi:hypothetical protein